MCGSNPGEWVWLSSQMYHNKRVIVSLMAFGSSGMTSPPFDGSCSEPQSGSSTVDRDIMVMVDEDVLEQTMSLNQKCSAEAIGEPGTVVV